MASKITKSHCLMLLMVAIVVVELASGSQTEQRCIYPKEITSGLDIQSRKMLPTGPTSSSSSSSVTGKKMVDGDELRTVPSGPDPLHHNGDAPKKPRTP